MLERVLAAVNTPGAHILICLGLLVCFSLLTATPLSHDIVVFALGILSRSMGSANKPEQLPPNTTTTATESSVTTKKEADPAPATSSTTTKSTAGKEKDG